MYTCKRNAAENTKKKNTAVISKHTEADHRKQQNLDLFLIGFSPPPKKNHKKNNNKKTKQQPTTTKKNTQTLQKTT